MTGNPEHDILIGAVGWQHAAWQDSYYPDDLPEDWRLPYYANEFQAVMVEEHSWSGLQANQLQAWLEDTEDEFKLFFSASLQWLSLTDTQTHLSDIFTLFNDYPDRIGGLLITRPSGITGDLPGLRRILGHTLPLVIDPRECTDNDRLLSLCKSLDADICWHPGNMGQYPEARHCNLGIIDTRTGLDNRALREQFEQFVAKLAPHRPSALFLTGDPPNISNLRDLRMMKELIMG